MIAFPDSRGLKHFHNDPIRSFETEDTIRLLGLLSNENVARCLNESSGKNDYFAVHQKKQHPLLLRFQHFHIFAP